MERRAGYQHVYSPVLAKRRLFELSGHWAHYRDDMFPPMNAGDDELVLRPSLCPDHALIYRARQHSYRDLPVRLAELGAQFREEASGVLGGLTCVRAMQLNDAHIFARPDQVAAEVHTVMDLIERAYQDLGIRAHRYRLSLRGHSTKYVDDQDMWDLGEHALAEVLAERGLAYDSEAGEGAFYGPKIDVQIVDPSGREATLSTVQLDYYQPAVGQKQGGCLGDEGSRGALRFDPELRGRRGRSPHRSPPWSMRWRARDLGALGAEGVDRCGGGGCCGLSTPGHDRLDFRDARGLRCGSHGVGHTGSLEVVDLHECRSESVHGIHQFGRQGRHRRRVLTYGAACSLILAIDRAGGERSRPCFGSISTPAGVVRRYW